jgi:hypothetical protein
VPGLELWLGGEAAYRFEDHALGRARRLGPRFEIAVGSRAIVAPWLSITGAARVRRVGDVELDQRSLAGTSERLVSMVLGVAADDRRRRFRSALSLSFDPPVASQGATAGMALGTSIALGFR